MINRWRARRFHRWLRKNNLTLFPESLARDVLVGLCVLSGSYIES